jgi:hypothetical protein
MDQVYVGASYFHIYVSILKQLNRQDKTSKSLLVLNNFTPGIESIIPFLKETEYFDHVIQVPFVSIKRRINTEKSTLSKILQRNRFELEYVDRNSIMPEYEMFIRNAEINVFQKRGLSQFYFILKYGRTNFIRMIEDGENNYFPKIGKFKAFRRRYLLNTAIGDGFDPEIKEIHVQHPHRLNERVRHKGRTLELKAMQGNLTTEQKSKIVNLFMHGKDINVHREDNLLLITQPWSEGKFTDEAGKVEVYNRLLKKYNNNHLVFLKAHPRDLTDYHGKLDFPFTEIPRAFPLEMLDLMENIHFKTGLTVSSSALHNLHCVKEKIFVGNDYLKEVNQTLSR